MPVTGSHVGPHLDSRKLTCQISHGKLPLTPSS